MNEQQEEKLASIVENKQFRKKVSVSVDVIFLNGINDDEDTRELIAKYLVDSIISGSGVQNYLVYSDFFIKADDNSSVNGMLDFPKAHIATVDISPLTISLLITTEIYTSAILNALISYKNPNIIICVMEVEYIHYFSDEEYKAALKGAYDR